MDHRFVAAFRILLFVILIMGGVFPPQAPAYAAATFTVTPITWNVVGLDSNNVNVGPNNFPVGARVCNTGNLTATGIAADFVWDTTDPYINLRTGSQDPITLTSLAAGACYDFYFEVTVTRDAAAYDNTARYHIQVSATNDGAGGTISVSSPTSREIYVEHLVSQNRNSVTDVNLDGVSIAAGGTMNLLVGSTYTIQLVGATATNGYEQIESFINFPNTIFRVNSVAATYTANAGTDASAASKLYADGCGWVNDPTSAAYRSCTGVGKYGGIITITYNVTIIGGGGMNQTLNTLIYDFSGSSYHYNSDFSTSYRTAIITDASSCTQANITQWTFTGNATTPSTGSGTFTPGSSLTSVATINTGNPSPALSGQNWSQTESIGTNAYYQFAVSTLGYNAINFNFDANVSNTALDKMDIYYSTDGSNFTKIGSTRALTTIFSAYNNDLSTINALNNHSLVTFRIYGFSSDAANRALRLDNVTVTGCQLPASINLTKNGVIDQTVVAPTDQTNVGDGIDYTMVIANNGGGSLTSISFTDTKAASLSCTPALAGLTLTPGQFTTCTGTYTLTQADFDAGSVTNTATANSAQAGPVTASTTQTLPQSPALTLFKSTTTNGFSNVGDAINYSYLFTNSGNVTLSAPYAVSDNRTTVTCPGTPTSIAPGAAITCTATYTIQTSDITSGNVVNTASATAKDPSGNTVTSNTSNVTVNMTPTATNTPTSTPTNTPTDTPTSTPTNTPTDTPTSTPTETPTPTFTPTDTPTNTPTDTPTNTPTDTPTSTPTNISTLIPPTNTSTNTPTDTPTSIPTDTLTSTPTDTPTNAPTSTLTPTPTDTATSTSTTTPTSTPTDAPTTTPTATNTPTDTPTSTPTITPTSTPTNAPTGTQTSTPTNTLTNTPTPPVQVADPALSKSGSPTSAAVGETITFTLVVTNHGNSPAPNVVVTDVLPSIFDVTAVHISGAPLGTQVNVTPPIGTGTAPYTVVVTLGGKLSVTDVVTIQIVTKVNDQGNPPINNTATLTNSALSDVISNNTDSVAIRIRNITTSARLPATGFAKGVQTILAPQPSNLKYTATDLMVEIPSLSVEIPIVGVPKKNGTWDVSWLADQAGWLEGSAFPSWSGNSVLTGHVYLASGLPGPFVNLNKLKYGDKIVIHAYGQKYIFEVQTSAIVTASDRSVMKHEEKSWLTLMTCKDYDERTKTYKNRTVVRALLVKVEWE